MSPIDEVVAAVTPGLTRGTVRAVDETGREPAYEIARASDGGVLRAQRALGCLIAPMVGDEVLVAADDPAAPYVLSVLRRGCEAPVSLELPRDGVLRTCGDLRLEASAALHLAGGTEAHLAAPSVGIQARTLEAAAASVGFAARTLRAQGEQVCIQAGTLSETCTVYHQSADTTHRVIQDLETVEAGQVQQTVRTLYSVQSGWTALLSEGVTKIDGEQVHMG